MFNLGWCIKVYTILYYPIPDQTICLSIESQRFGWGSQNGSIVDNTVCTNWPTCDLWSLHIQHCAHDLGMSSFTYSFTLTNLHQFKFRLQTSLLNPLITFDEKCDKILEGKVLRNVTHRLTKNNPFRSITSDNNNYHHTYLNT